MNGTHHFDKGIQLVPQNTFPPISLGDIRYNSSTNKLELFYGSLDSVVTEAGAATLTNKVLTGNTAVNLISGAGTFVLNTSGTITIPSVTDTLVGKSTTDTLANKTLNNTNVIVVKDNNFTIQDNADTTKQLQFELSSITAATTRTLVIPDVNDTIAVLASAQTFTNKTINAPSNTITNIADANISSSAAISYSKLALTGTIVNSDVNASAAIARSKLAALTANRAMATDASGFDTVSSTTDVELGYVSGVTSSIQTQINGITLVPAPPGMMTMFAGSSAPTGWLFCDGSVLAQSGLYANLFAAIGSTWNIGGEGAGNFRLPNTAGLFPRGAGTQTVGGISYSATLATLTGDKLQGHFHGISDPSHNHSISDPSHVHSSGTSGSGVGGFGGFIQATNGNTPGAWSTPAAVTGIAVQPATTGITVQSPTNDGSHGTPRIGSETAPASFGINFMIKY